MSLRPLHGHLIGQTLLQRGYSRPLTAMVSKIRLPASRVPCNSSATSARDAMNSHPIGSLYTLYSTLGSLYSTCSHAVIAPQQRPSHDAIALLQRGPPGVLVHRSVVEMEMRFLEGRRQSHVDPSIPPIPSSLDVDRANERAPQCQGQQM